MIAALGGSAYTIATAPLLAWWAITALGGIAVVVLLFGVWRRARGIGWRAVAVAMLLAILVNPSLVEEKRSPLHVWLSGRPGERDRRLVVAHAPSFGLVSKEAPLTIRVEDSPEPTPERKPETKTPSQGAPERQARLTWRKDGAAPHQMTVPV